MLRPPRVLSSAAPLLIAAVVGGGVALAGAALLDVFDDTQTVQVPVSSIESSAPADFAQDRRLSVNEIYRRSAPGVVQITTTSIRQVEPDPFLNPFGFPEEQRQQALGSGFVIDTAGRIVTNYHVVQGAQQIEVSFSNRDSVRARVIGTDPSTDIAVLKVNVDARALRPLELGNSDRVRVGDSVVAIGNPLGLERSVTAGIVSALHRPLQPPNHFTIDDVIQTDASINRGNSGGPLIAANGSVVAVNTAIATGNTGSGGNIGIGFAVPMNTVRNVVSQLIAEGKVEHPFIGVGAQQVDKEIAQLFNLPADRGLLVVRVYDGSGAAEAGLRAGTREVVIDGQSYLLGGDFIVEIDGKPVSEAQDLRRAIMGRKVGDEITIEAYRGDERRSFEVKLGRQPATSQDQGG
ncbi:MAG TPA: trypsin-like peptidase domain-containing protein [Gaiellaceae bacterium]|nr:trypsin-like peptidase domain-containing protein [Gaiellaceae bacterium]